jgi:uncharacterized protein YggE
MKRLGLTLLVLASCAAAVSGQVSGNRNYGREQGRQQPSTGTVGSPSDLQIDAYVLLNAPADEFVVVFGVSQEGPTAAESNQRVNARIEQFLDAAGKLGVARANTYVDFITQNRVYNFAPAQAAAGNTIRESLTGFETKKTVTLRYKDKTILERLVAAAAQASIFDLIKVDYVVTDLAKVRARLFEEALRVLRQKEERYAGPLGMAIRRQSLTQETYNTFYPAALYKTYSAFESGSVETGYDSQTRVVRERKSSTSFLEPLDASAFDAVINPVGVEPLVQFTLYLKVRYTIAM